MIDTPLIHDGLPIEPTVINDPNSRFHEQMVRVDRLAGCGCYSCTLLTDEIDPPGVLLSNGPGSPPATLLVPRLALTCYQRIRT